MALPRAVRARFGTTTDNTGLAQFPPLPLGMIADFALADQTSKPTKFGLGDLRGGKWAPLGAENALPLEHQFVRRTITLLQPIRLQGRITLPDGDSKGNVLVLARRINAAEAADKDNAHEQIIARTRSNARGQYVMDGLRPGRYYVWTYTEKQLTRDYASQVFERDLKAPINRVDFKLTRGAIIEGVVNSKATGQPVKGQTMWLFDSQENNQYAITDARGFFQFRALGGKQRLRVHANGSNSPPPGFVLPAKSEFNFAIENGEKREFRIELPGAAVTKPISGTVVGPDGKAAAGAAVLYRVVGSYRSLTLKQVTADAWGDYALPLADSTKAVQLFADKGELTTPVPVVAVAGKSAQLSLARDAWASIEGQVLDQQQRPLAGATVNLAHFYGTTGVGGDKTVTDATGHYRYERLRPGTTVLFTLTKTGSANDSPPNFIALKTGQTRQLDLTMKRAPETLAGVVYGTDGKPARNYQVSVSGLSTPARTGAKGHFLATQVFEGRVSVWVFAPNGWIDGAWKSMIATGGDQNLVIRLAQMPRDTRFQPSEFKGIKPQSLVGQMAPPILETKWSDNRAHPLSALRGETVCLTFSNFNGNDGELTDFERSFGDQIRFVGVRLKSENSRNPRLQESTDEIARRMGFPIAVDAALPNRKSLGWQTFQSYGHARYAVIGRDGKIVYAGDQINRALAFATATN